MNRNYLVLLVSFVSACAESAPPAQTADNAATTSAAAPGLPEALGKATCGATNLDDLEDGDGRSLVTENRGGYWYTYKDSAGSTVDPQGSFTPTEGGANGSKFAANMHGKTADSGIVYAGLGFNLTDPMAPYDLSAAKGFCFQAKGKGPVRVKLPDVNTAPEGGQCKQCYNDFGVEFALTEEWKEYCFDFAQLKQQSGWGEQKPALSTDHAFSIQWQISANATDFDVSVDDVRLVCEAAQ
jgi:endoglucanase